MNVIKHAKAHRVDVSVRSRDGFLFIEVRDDGEGVEAPSLFDKAGHNGGFGLFSIRERLHSVGGELEIESAPGRGFLAILKTPLNSRVDPGTMEDD
jgi:signal transduction histidine kinase